jgi:hypothetical protein
MKAPERVGRRDLTEGERERSNMSSNVAKEPKNSNLADMPAAKVVPYETR